MKNYFPDYYSKFKCTAGDCPDTCCAGWEIVLDEKAVKLYEEVEGELGEKLRSVMSRDDDGDDIFTLREDGLCPFLNGDGLCELQLAFGERALCRTCGAYPRFTEEFGARREIGISLSCPEAARLIFSSEKPTKFVLEEDEEPITCVNDIDGELFLALKNARDCAVDTARSRELDVWDRLRAVLNFSYRLQARIERRDISGIERLCRRQRRKPFLENMARERAHVSRRYSLMPDYIELLLTEMEFLRPSWPKLLRETERLSCARRGREYNALCAEFADFSAGFENEYENLMVYFMFRYFMKSVFDKRALLKMKLAAYSCIVIRELHFAQWEAGGKQLEKPERIELARLYSREIEHSAENMEAIYQALETKRQFSVRRLSAML